MLPRTPGVKQQQILDFIRSHVAEKGYPPSVREIGEAVGLRSTSTVHGYLERLEKAGYIRRDPTKPRAIELRTAKPPWAAVPTVYAPIVGKVTAGLPILALENLEGTLPVPIELARGQDVFLLRISGDSMMGAGIIDGDLVVVRPQAQAEEGDVVVALLGEEATVKRFYREPGRVRLQAENPAYPPIYATEVTIIGRVIGLFRRL